MSRLRLLIADSGTGPTEHRSAADAPPIQVPPSLRQLVRGGQLQRGTVVSVQDRTPQPVDAGGNYLAIALAAAASASGSWCGVIGMPSFGIAAASGLGAKLGRFLCLDYPGERWAEAVAIMVGVCDLVLCQPPRRVGTALGGRLRARIRPADRQRGAVLITMGDWPGGADLRLSTRDPQWTGLGEGTGHLTGRQVTVTATGRAAAGYEPDVRTASGWRRDHP